MQQVLAVLDEREELLSLLEEAGGLLWRLEKYGYITAPESDDASQCDHWRSMGRVLVLKIQARQRGES